MASLDTQVTNELPVKQKSDLLLSIARFHERKRGCPDLMFVLGFFGCCFGAVLVLFLVISYHPAAFLATTGYSDGRASQNQWAKGAVLTVYGIP
jgi:hypothetical protein